MNRFALFIILQLFSYIVFGVGLKWGTYVGGIENDNFLDIVTDHKDGSVYVVGYTNSPDFPAKRSTGINPWHVDTLNGIEPDIVILKFSHDNELIWSTYFGGTGADNANSIDLDSKGNLYITGFTQSTDLPLKDLGGGAWFQNTAEGGGDVCMLKFSADGELLWSTYLGGFGADRGNSVVVDKNDNVFITGQTWSSNFPMAFPGGFGFNDTLIAGLNDAFACKFDNTGKLTWSTFLGGNVSEWGASITVDDNNNVFATGNTSSSDFPTEDPGNSAWFVDTLNTFDDVFICKFSNAGEMLWSTYYGGIGSDIGTAAEADEDGNIFITGQTSSFDLPVKYPGYGYFDNILDGNSDAFLLKFDNKGEQIWATFFGGEDLEFGAALSINDCGNITATGFTLSTTLPMANLDPDGYAVNTNSGNADMYIVQFNENHLHLWTSFVGTNVFDYGAALTSNLENDLYLTGDWGGPASNGYKDAGGDSYMQPAQGNSDGMIMKFNSPPTPLIHIIDSAVCIGDSIIFLFEFTDSVVDQPTFDNNQLLYFASEDTTIILTAINTFCTLKDSFNVSVDNFPTLTTSVEDSICNGEELTINFTNGTQYYWDNALVNSAFSIIVDGSDSVVYNYKYINGACSDSGTFSLLIKDCDVLVYFPNAFSPNSGAENNMLRPIIDNPSAITNMEWAIYDNHGKLLYRATSISGEWDGTFQGKPAANGVYIVKGSYNSVLGANTQFLLNCTLIR